MFERFLKKKPVITNIQELSYKDVLSRSYKMLEQVPDININKERLKHKLDACYNVPKSRITTSLRAQLEQLHRRISLMGRQTNG